MAKSRKSNGSKRTSGFDDMLELRDERSKKGAADSANSARRASAPKKASTRKAGGKAGGERGVGKVGGATRGKTAGKAAAKRQGPTAKASKRKSSTVKGVGTRGGRRTSSRGQG